jgi:hypothetical protein
VRARSYPNCRSVRTFFLDDFERFLTYTGPARSSMAAPACRRASHNSQRTRQSRWRANGQGTHPDAYGVARPTDRVRTHEVASAGTSPAATERMHRHRRIVRMDHAARRRVRANLLGQGPRRLHRLANPVGEQSRIQIHAVADIDFGRSIAWKMVAIFMVRMCASKRLPRLVRSRGPGPDPLGPQCRSVIRSHSGFYLIGPAGNRVQSDTSATYPARVDAQCRARASPRTLKQCRHSRRCRSLGLQPGSAYGSTWV